MILAFVQNNGLKSSSLEGTLKDLKVKRWCRTLNSFTIILRKIWRWRGRSTQHISYVFKSNSLVGLGYKAIKRENWMKVIVNWNFEWIVQ